MRAPVFFYNSQAASSYKMPNSKWSMVINNILYFFFLLLVVTGILDSRYVKTLIVRFFSIFN